MPIKHRIGYDIINTYKEEELQKMYINEGMPPSEAKIKARTLCLALNKMAASERRLWERIRDNEMCVGGEPEYHDGWFEEED